MRGVLVAEVCAVYGVALPGASHDEHAGHAHHHADPSGHGDQGSHSATAHIGDHCALTALAALAVPDQAALAVTSSERSPAYPDLPTVAEVGVPGYAAESWYGLYAPAKTPAPIIFAIELLVPVALAVLVVGEDWERSSLVAILAALALVVGGALALARTPTVARLLGEAGS